MQVTVSGVEDGGDGLREGSNPCESQVSGLDRESSSQEMKALQPEGIRKGWRKWCLN